MKLGKLTIRSEYVKPDDGGIHRYKVFCACCARQQSGPVGSRSGARLELHEYGWKYDQRIGGWRCDTCARPKIVHVERNRFRLEGGALSPDWSRAHKRYLEREKTAGREVPTGPPWCEVTMIDLDDARGIVSSFGGAVWPAAYPDLFTISPQQPDGDGSTRLTDRGLRLFREVTR